LIMQATGARVDAQAAVESKAREEALTEALALANSQNADLRAENTRLRARLEMVQNGMLARVDE